MDKCPKTYKSSNVMSATTKWKCKVFNFVNLNEIYSHDYLMLYFYIFFTFELKDPFSFIWENHYFSMCVCVHVHMYVFV